jgi:predicted nucleic acid-binding protein
MTERMPPLVYVDANPFMYAFETAPEIANPLLALMEAFKRKPGAAVTSEIVLGELLAPVRRPGALSAAEKRTIYLNLLVFNQWFDLRPVTRSIVLGSASLREGTNLKLVDAVHLATALHAGCRFILSNDRDMDRGVGRLRRVQPDADGIEMLVGALT